MLLRNTSDILLLFHCNVTQDDLVVLVHCDNVFNHSGIDQIELSSTIGFFASRTEVFNTIQV